MPDRRQNLSSRETARAGTHNDHLDPRRVRRYSAGARRLLGCLFSKHDWMHEGSREMRPVYTVMVDKGLMEVLKSPSRSGLTQLTLS